MTTAEVRMRLLTLLATVVLLTACAEETPAGTQADDFVLPLTKQSLDELWSATLVEANPSPPAKGNNEWRLSVSDANGTAMADANLSVRLFMPQHGHGSSAPEVAPSEISGEYDLSRINFIMGGVWEVRVYEEGAAADHDILFLVDVAD